MIKFMLTIIHRDLLLLIRQPSETLNPLVFFLLVIALFPLGISPEATLLSKTAAGMIWVAAMLATLLSLELLFKLDHDDGSLEQLLLAPYPSWSLVLAKVFVHWLMSGLPLILISPVIASMLFLPSQAVPVLMLSLLLGTPTLSLLGAIGAALVTGVRGGRYFVDTAHFTFVCASSYFWYVKCGGRGAGFGCEWSHGVNGSDVGVGLNGGSLGRWRSIKVIT